MFDEGHATRRADINAIKCAANELSEILIKQGADAALKRYREIFDKDVYSVLEMDIMLRLTMTYAAAKQGRISRKEATIKQNKLIDVLNVLEVEE